MRFLALLVLLVPLRAQPALDRKIDPIIESAPVAARAFLGIEVVELKTGRVLYGRNADRFFVPASNMKLFTTALALVRLGPDYRFETRVVSDAAPDAQGVLRGGLVLAGGGDPSLSGRVIPYQKDAKGGPPLGPIEALADQVVSAGVRRVEGDIVGDDMAYPWEPYPDGWAFDDGIWDYGAPVSALTVNDNSLTVSIRPAHPGQLAHLSLSPALEYYAIDNRVLTVERGETKVQVERLPGSRQIRLWGTVSASNGGDAEILAIDDPALYAACALYDALTRRGVAVVGRPMVRHRFLSEDLAATPGLQTLAVRRSPPLVELLRVVDKVSQNLHAELMLREVGRVRRNEGTRKSGLEEMKSFLEEAGIPAGDVHFEDGSGLSRLTLVTPRALARLLAYMNGTPLRDAFRGLLPIAAEDGTLAHRFHAGGVSSVEGRIVAKTGSLSHVAALSGYADSTSLGPLAFSIVVNNSNTPASEIRQVIDKIALALLE